MQMKFASVRYTPPYCFLWSLLTIFEGRRKVIITSPCESGNIDGLFHKKIDIFDGDNNSMTV